MFLDFFFNKKQPKKNKTKQAKTETKHVHKQLKELNQGQVTKLTLASLFSPL